MSDGKHSLQTRGLIVLLISKAAGTAPGMDVMEKDLVSGILPRLVVTLNYLSFLLRASYFCSVLQYFIQLHLRFTELLI